MSRIKILPPEIARKIAAGEVVERPLSVVKELVENALDAGATEIGVELAQGGKTLIRVSDNGHGMTPEEAGLCFERHSTSKIASEADLLRIKTMGFRGEALPSITAVSRVKLKTSVDGQVGTLVEREADQVIRVEEVACPRGTIVEVRDLFFNLPARRKFLRSQTTELSRITNFLISSAQAFPSIRFKLRHNAKEIFNYAPVKNLKERLFQIYGHKILDRLVEVDFSKGQYQITGFVSRPPQGRGDRTRQFCYINHRWVADKLILAAVTQSFRGWLEKGKHPESWLFLTIPPEEVDVNVHPAKAEVRFCHPQEVFRLVSHALEQAIKHSLGIKDITSPSLSAQATSSKVGEEKGVFSRLTSPGATLPSQPEISSAEKVSPRFQEKEARSQPRGPEVLGQFLGLYIIAVSSEGLLVIDQHNAHERVLYERYLEIYREKSWPRKSPLFPIVIELSPDQEVKLREVLPYLESAGFRVEPMGGQAYALQEFPDILSEDEAQETLEVLLQELGSNRRRKAIKMEEKNEAILATLACRTAIKAGEILSYSRMQYLVEELFKTSNPSLCPHGRPILVKLSIAEIEKALGRR